VDGHANAIKDGGGQFAGFVAGDEHADAGIVQAFHIERADLLPLDAVGGLSAGDPVAELDDLEPERRLEESVGGVRMEERSPLGRT